MKPWNASMFQTTCVNCGARGYNLDAWQEWMGAEFVCGRGCEPERVRRFQRDKANEAAKKLEEKALLHADGGGI